MRRIICNQSHPLIQTPFGGQGLNLRFTEDTMLHIISEIMTCRIMCNQSHPLIQTPFGDQSLNLRFTEDIMLHIISEIMMCRIMCKQKYPLIHTPSLVARGLTEKVVLHIKLKEKESKPTRKYKI